MRWIWRKWSARFVFFAIAFAAILVPRLDIARATLWSIALGVAMAISSGSLRQWQIQRRKRRLVQHAAGLVEPRDGQLVAVSGTIEPEGETLRSPIYDEECVAYQYSMSHTVHHRGLKHRGGRTSDLIDDYGGFGAVPAAIHGEYFKARLGSFPWLHGFGRGQSGLGEMLQKLEEQPATAVSLRDVSAVASAMGESAGKLDQSRLENADRYLRSVAFDELPKGEVLGHITLWDKKWDGKLRFAKNFRRELRKPSNANDEELPYDPKKCDFWEQRVAPGVQVCAVGIWSESEHALVAPPGHLLELYPGTPQEAAKTVSAAVGCAWFFAVLLAVASAATTIYLVQPQFLASP